MGSVQTKGAGSRLHPQLESSSRASTPDRLQNNLFATIEISRKNEEGEKQKIVFFRLSKTYKIFSLSIENFSKIQDIYIETILL
jgi:hypothetical protein